MNQEGIKIIYIYTPTKSVTEPKLGPFTHAQ